MNLTSEAVFRPPTAQSPEGLIKIALCLPSKAAARKQSDEGPPSFHTALHSGVEPQETTQSQFLVPSQLRLNGTGLECTINTNIVLGASKGKNALVFHIADGSSPGPFMGQSRLSPAAADDLSHGTCAAPSYLFTGWAQAQELPPVGGTPYDLAVPGAEPTITLDILYTYCAQWAGKHLVPPCITNAWPSKDRS